jgi:hypothetical protein
VSPDDFTEIVRMVLCRGLIIALAVVLLASLFFAVAGGPNP